MSNAKLSPKQRRHLSGLGHTLQPIVIVGKEGVTEGVIAALEQALIDHELVKVRVGNSATANRKDVADELLKKTAAELAGLVGKTMLLYKAHPEKPKIKLPKQ